MKPVFITGCHVKLVQASFGARKDTEHVFQFCGGSVNLVHDNLGVHSKLKGSFHYSEGLVELWNGIFNARKDLENSFNRSGSPVKLMHASLGDRKGIERIFRNAEVQQGSFTPVRKSGGMLKGASITVDVM